MYIFFFKKRFLTCKASCKFFSCSWLWPFWDMNSLLILTNSVSATSVWIDAFAISALSSCLSFINCSIFCSFSFRADFNLSGAKKIQANTLNQAKIVVSELVHPKTAILKIIWMYLCTLFDLNIITLQINKRIQTSSSFIKIWLICTPEFKLMVRIWE